MKNFHLADGFPGDLKRLIVTRMLIQASSGGGKSWALRRLLEQTHGALQQLVIDPEGEFFTLREKFDYVLVAKQGGDAAAEPRIAGLLVERLLELNVSAILDLYELKIDQRVLFVKNFLEALIDAPRKLWHPALVIVDEAHVFCPEKEKAESAGAVKDLCTRGRKRGFCGVLATQRLAKLAKDAAAECANKLIGRTNLDVDLKRAADELGFKDKDSWQDLRNLGDGDFFAYGPALTPEVRRIHVGAVLTTHPKVGMQLAGDAPPPTEKIKALLPKLSDLPAEQERKAKTEADLRGEIRSLKAQLAARPALAPAPKPIEVQVLDKALVARLEKAVLEHAKLQLVALEAGGRVQMAIKDLQGAVEAARRQPPAPAKPNPFASRPRLVARQAPWLDSPTIRSLEENGRTSGPELRVLNALAELEALGVPDPERVQVAFLAGYTNLASKGFANAMGALSSAGRIAYPSTGRLALTDEGRALASKIDAPRTSEEIQERVLSLLGGSSERLLRPLIESYPAALERTRLAEAAGYTNLASKGFANAIGRLRSLGFIDYPTRGQVVARSVLFLEGGS